MVNAGWLTVYGKEAADEDTPSLAPVKPGETVKTAAIEVKPNVTKPPARYSEATLLGDGRRGQAGRRRGIARGHVARKAWARRRRARPSSRV
jgi:DNA topoisomerase IA